MLGKITVVMKNSITRIVRMLYASKILVSVCVHLATIKMIAFTQKVNTLTVMGVTGDRHSVWL